MSRYSVDTAFIPFLDCCKFFCITESRVSSNRFDTIIGKVPNRLRRFLAELFSNLILRLQLLSNLIGIKHTLKLTRKCLAIVRSKNTLLVVITTNTAFGDTAVAIAIGAVAKTIHGGLRFIFDLTDT